VANYGLVASAVNQGRQTPEAGGGRPTLVAVAAAASMPMMVKVVVTVGPGDPPDYKEWEGKSNKRQYFSPNPGAGD